MNLQNLLEQFIGTGNNQGGGTQQGSGSALGKLADNIPGGLAGGAAAGGIMALLIGNKKARKIAGKVAGYGGAAVLGGIAYKAFQNWQQGNQAAPENGTGSTTDVVPPPAQQQPVAPLVLIKAMIAAAKSDGHIDSEEQTRIFDAVNRMELGAESKGMVFDLLSQPIPVQELAAEARDIEHKSEIYLASCMVIEPDHPAERAHLDQLASALALPDGLGAELEAQVREAMQS